MMNFQEFTGCIAEEFGNKISGLVQVVPVTKNNNVTLTGLTVTCEESNISPTIYLEGYYEAYKQGKNFYEIVAEIQTIYMENKAKKNFDISGFVEKEKMIKRLSFKLINYERNEKLLSDIPHRRFLDMAVVYYYFLETDEHGMGTILIYNHHMDFWNITEEEMFKIAYENYLKLHPAHIESMQELVFALLEANELGIDESRAGMEMLVVTNKEKLYGATMMLFPDILKPVSELLQQDLYIIPSSIHEILVLPHLVMSAEELRELVREVNRTCVITEEILGENVYRYFRESNTIEIVLE